MSSHKIINQYTKSLLSIAIILLILTLACGMPTSALPAETSNVIGETQVAMQMQLTTDARQVELMNQQLTQAVIQVTMEAQHISATQSVPPPTFTVAQPTYTPYPTYTSQPTLTKPAAPPTSTEPPPSGQLTYPQPTKSTSRFYCYQEPYSVKITQKVPDINVGMTVYFRIQDKTDGRKTDWENKDLHRDGSDARSATIVGGGSSSQDIHYPPLMHESWFQYQIIADDGTYRSPVYSDITFYPCAQ
jgi:hypothetical protein